MNSQRQVRDDLLHERGGVHHRCFAIQASELPVSHHADRPAHASSRYAYMTARPAANGYTGAMDDSAAGTRESGDE